MKQIGLVAAVLLMITGCTTTQVQQLTQPAQVQNDLTTLGLVAKAYLTPAEVASITQLKQAAYALENGSLPIAQFQMLIARVTPTKDAPAFAIALAALNVLFGEVYQQYGVGNSVFNQYCAAVYNGLSAAGY